MAGGSCEGVTEEEIAGGGGAEAEEAAGGSDWDEIAAEEGAIEVFPGVFGGVEEEGGTRIGVVADHEEPRISTRDLRAGKVEAF